MLKWLRKPFCYTTIFLIVEVWSYHIFRDLIIPKAYQSKHPELHILRFLVFSKKIKALKQKIGLFTFVNNRIIFFILNNACDVQCASPSKISCCWWWWAITIIDFNFVQFFFFFIYLFVSASYVGSIINRSFDDHRNYDLQWMGGNFYVS